MMKPQKRQAKLLTIMRAMQREVHVDELAEMMDVSSITIRRDLDQLTAGRTVIRTHGGCLLVGRAALETEYHKKVRKNFGLKQAVGVAASEMVNDGDVLLLNDGSTTFHLGAHLGTKKNLSVYTNSLALVTELARFPSLELYILGGRYSNDQYSLRGSMLEKTLESYVFDTVFMGADAVDEKGRCYVESPEEARMVEIMLRSGRRRILMADHTKICAHGHCVYGTLSGFDTWITTEGIDPEILENFSLQTEVLIAGASEE